MIPEFGHFALILALCMAVVLSVVPMLGSFTGNYSWMALARPASRIQFLLVAVSYAVLTYTFINHDFSVGYVANTSNLSLPLIYRISGVWGGHEGSLLLWLLVLTAWTALVSIFSRGIPLLMLSRVLSVLGMISVGFTLFVLLTSNPFSRLLPAPVNGQSLNPLLQDFGLAVHPPMLYMGYVGFSVAFAFAVAALIGGRLDMAWAKWMRPWTNIAWVFLTIGIALGSWWAYYELGWGGWWFWDPVENASFMPWLAGTALLHSAIVVERRNALRVWTVLLAILTFSLSLLGTFIVRSGLLTSVHSFATDPTRGIVILAILLFFIGGSLALFAFRSSSLTQGGLFAPISREGGLVLNNLFLSAATATVLIGTLYPLFYEAASGNKISVGPPFFNLTMVPLCIPLLFAMPYGPFMAWKRADIVAVSQRLLFAFGLSMLAILTMFIVTQDGPVLAPLGVGLGVWLVMGAVSEIFWRAKIFQVKASETLRRLRHLPLSNYGAAFGHAGMGLTVLGAVAVTAYGTEEFQELKPGGVIKTAGFEMHFKTIVPERANNYVQDVAVFEVHRNGTVIDEMRPAKRLYPARQFPTTESDIRTYGLSQLYISLGDVKPDGTAVVRAYWKPFVTLIWIGSIVMFLGGLFSIADRRLRIGVPEKAVKSKMIAAE